MPNLELLRQYNQQFPEKKIHFLESLSLDWEQRKPLQGIKVLHNLVNTFETLHKLEPLLRAGADLTVTRCDLIDSPSLLAVEKVMKECEIRYVPSYKDLKGTFDIGMDCAARLISIPSISFSIGIVELTQSGTVLYRKAKTSYPVISVDDSFLKNLECMYGTGESFLRAIQEFTGEEIQGKKFVVFGYGKIGQGITKYLSQHTQNIVVVEKSLSSLELAQKRGLEAVSAESSLEIVRHASQAFAIVTATGVPNLLSRYVSPAELKSAAHPYIANMGAEDEIGETFETYDKVLCNRAPINFSLQNPTRMKYLDPIFYAHNLAAEILADPKRRPGPGYHAFDPQLDRAIIEEWVKLHGERVDDIWETQ